MEELSHLFGRVVASVGIEPVLQLTVPLLADVAG